MSTKRYDQCLVSGQHSRLIMIALCSHSASSKKQLNGLKDKLGVGYEIGKLEGTAEYTKMVKPFNLSHFNAKETNFMPTLKGFLKGYTPVPYLALLTNYLYSAHSAPVQKERFISPLDVNETFQEICIMTIYISDAGWKDDLVKWKRDLEKRQGRSMNSLGDKRFLVKLRNALQGDGQG
ncbi:hypothetical protein AOQ84DRAFT_382077 [Glonium stellatum]|uniref:Uncharacterized protein n=1 Tax=Glonium stellatum TaxID=574774 RepID=A0A8E2EQP8_9PEZI|nr:hypothetical protein AOQ84DRAFT_382077 [Glonium stellatum]